MDHAQQDRFSATAPKGAWIGDPRIFATAATGLLCERVSERVVALHCAPQFVIEKKTLQMLTDGRNRNIVDGLHYSWFRDKRLFSSPRSTRGGQLGRLSAHTVENGIGYILGEIMG